MRGAATHLRAPITQAASATLRAVRKAAATSRGGAAAAGASLAASEWLVCDDPASRTRYVCIAAPAGWSSDPATLQRDLTSFESYSLATKINKKMYAEASALYVSLLDLVVQEEEEREAYRVCFTVRHQF